MAEFPSTRLRQAGISAARVTAIQATYNTWRPDQQAAFRRSIASRTDEQLRHAYDPGVIPDAGTTTAQVVADPALLTAVQGAILTAHDTDAERETFTPSRLSDAALRAAFDAEIAAKGGGTSASWLTNTGIAKATSLDLTWATAASGPVITVPTGIAGNEVVEPSVLFDATAPFLGYEYAMCISPYPSSNTAFENPCLFVSHDGNTWIPLVNGVPTPGGTVTPVMPTGVQGDGALSDQHLYRGPDGTFYILTNQFLTATGSGGTGTGGKNWCIKGVSAPSLAGPWTTPVTIVATTIASTGRPSSPSIFWDGKLWHMYAVDLANTSATSILHYTNPAANPLSGTWTQLANPTIALPAGYTGQVWWHLNAYRIGSTHVLLVQDSRAGASAGGNEWLLYSNDGGATWVVPPQPVLKSTATYRSAFVVTDRPGAGTVLDLFYGFLGATWELHRTTVTFGQPVVDPDALSSGESTMPRKLLAFGSNVVNLGNGSIRGTQFTATKTETINNVRMYSGNVAAVGATLCRLGIYEVSGNTHTLVASTVSDTTLFTTINTAYTKALTAPFQKVAGRRYSVCALIVGATTVPNVIGVLGNAEVVIAPALVSRIDSQTDLPASFTTIASASSVFYAAVTP